MIEPAFLAWHLASGVLVAGERKFGVARSELRAWDLETGAELWQTDYPNGMTFSFSRDGKQWIGGHTASPGAWAWSARTGERLLEMPRTIGDSAKTFAPDVFFEPTESRPDARTVRRARAQKVVRGIEDAELVTDVAVAGTHIVTGGTDGALRVWGTGSKEVARFEEPTEIDRAQCSRDGRFVAIATKEATRICALTFGSNSQSIRKAATSQRTPDAQVPGAVQESWRVESHDREAIRVRRGNDARTLPISGDVLSAAFSDDGRHLAVLCGRNECCDLSDAMPAFLRSCISVWDTAADWRSHPAWSQPPLDGPPILGNWTGRIEWRPGSDGCWRTSIFSSPRCGP